MRIATWNVNSLKARLERVEQWLVDMQPDVLCMQETKLSDEAFPALTFMGMGYETAHHGQGQWNGVAILSKVGLSDVVMNFAEGDPDPDARVVSAVCGGVRVSSVILTCLSCSHWARNGLNSAVLRRMCSTLAANALLPALTPPAPAPAPPTLPPPPPRRASIVNGGAS